MSGRDPMDKYVMDVLYPRFLIGWFSLLGLVFVFALYLPAEANTFGLVAIGSWFAMMVFLVRQYSNQRRFLRQSQGTRLRGRGPGQVEKH